MLLGNLGLDLRLRGLSLRLFAEDVRDHVTLYFFNLQPRISASDNLIQFSR